MRETEKLAINFRAKVIEMSHTAKTAHLASSLSCIDIIAVLYGQILNINSNNLLSADRDRFILSKGHAAAALYVALVHKKILNESDLDTYGQVGSLLEEHPSPKLPGVEAATGSLGHGLPFGCGIALAGRIRGLDYRTFILMSDGECNEGSVWEAAMFAAGKRLGSLCALVDFNKWQATGRSREVLALDPLIDKFSSFGWKVHEIDGHDHEQITNAVSGVTVDNEKPTMVIAHTVKGKGVSFMEDDNNWHYRVPTSEEVLAAKVELGGV
ncbi:MAG: transketolase [Elusimicrobia bacterium]|nr:MAG: transketolase [Elusimicrobiota bacterium]